MKAREYFTQSRKAAKEKAAKFFASLHLCVKYSFLLIVFASCTHKPSGPLAFVTNERDGTITVIDTKTDTVYSTIKLGGRLRGIRLSPDKQRIWVAISYPTNQSQGEDKTPNSISTATSSPGTKPVPIRKTSSLTTTPHASTSPTKTPALRPSPTSKQTA
jgi:YVTN family beta-propeller protein